MVRFATIRVNRLVGGKESHQSRTIPSRLINVQSGTVEYFTPLAIHTPVEKDIVSGRECSKKHALSLSEGSVQSCPEAIEGKAAAILTRGAYMEYVSTAKWRERRWRLFSTFPRWVFQTCGYKNESCTLLAVEKLRNLLQL